MTFPSKNIFQMHGKIFLKHKSTKVNLEIKAKKYKDFLYIGYQIFY